MEFVSHVARCDECVDLLVDYLEGALPAERARALETHLELCPACWRFVNTYRGTVHIAKSLPVADRDVARHRAPPGGTVWTRHPMGTAP